jgi:tetratricopeptide (TPR) repeat protein
MILASLLVAAAASLAAVPCAPPVANAVAAAAGRAADPAAVARELRELRRAEQHATALALVAEQSPSILADPRVAGERIQLLLDEDRLEEARAVHAALGEVRLGPQPLLAARLLLEIADGRAAEALEHADRTLPGLRQPFEVQAARLRALCALERWEEAGRDLAALPGDFPGLLRVRLHVDILLAHGKALTEDEDLLERAIPLLEEALALQPARIDVRTELVIALSQWHRADRAEQLVREVLDGVQGPRRAGLLYALGRVHRAELRDEQAVECFREVLALSPDHGRATLALARSLVHLGSEDEALALVQRRLQRVPEDPEAWFLVAEHALEHREPQAAVDALQHVLDRHPLSLKALYMRSRALALLGDTERQVDALRRYADRTAALAMR